MDASPFGTETTVAKALELRPAGVHAFMSRGTACVGCYMARFCTLRDAASAYGLELGPFITELQAADEPDTPDTGGKNGKAL